MVKILDSIIQPKGEGKKLLAILIDPDSIQDSDQVVDVIRKAEKASVDYIFFGGSLITKTEDFDSLKMIKEITTIPVVLFPSSPAQIRSEADAILFLSLLSGRNPEYLIGHHVASRTHFKKFKSWKFFRRYLLIGCEGRPTTAEYVGGTQPLPYHKPVLLRLPPWRAEMLGLKLIYLDGGSGGR